MTLNLTMISWILYWRYSEQKKKNPLTVKKETKEWEKIYVNLTIHKESIPTNTENASNSATKKQTWSKNGQRTFPKED